MVAQGVKGGHFAVASSQSLCFYTATFFSPYFISNRGKEMFEWGEARLWHRFREMEAHFLDKYKYDMSQI